jgi:hypothetical protein
MQLVGYNTKEVTGKILVKEYITDEYKTAVQAVLYQAPCREETVNFEFPINNCKEGEEGGSVGEIRMGWQGNKFGKNNDGKGDAIHQMTLNESEICQVEDNCAWWLATIALLAFLCFKDVINSNRLFVLHLTCLHLMRYRCCC